MYLTEPSNRADRRSNARFLRAARRHGYGYTSHDGRPGGVSFEAYERRRFSSRTYARVKGLHRAGHLDGAPHDAALDEHALEAVLASLALDVDDLEPAPLDAPRTGPVPVAATPPPGEVPTSPVVLVTVRPAHGPTVAG